VTNPIQYILYSCCSPPHIMFDSNAFFVVVGYNRSIYRKLTWSNTIINFPLGRNPLLGQILKRALYFDGAIDKIGAW